jgi:hypothetical protein
MATIFSPSPGNPLYKNKEIGIVRRTKNKDTSFRRNRLFLHYSVACPVAQAVQKSKLVHNLEYEKGFGKI